MTTQYPAQERTKVSITSGFGWAGFFSDGLCFAKKARKLLLGMPETGIASRTNSTSPFSALRAVRGATW